MRRPNTASCSHRSLSAALKHSKTNSKYNDSLRNAEHKKLEGKTKKKASARPAVIAPYSCSTISYRTVLAQSKQAFAMINPATNTGRKNAAASARASNGYNGKNA